MTRGAGEGDFASGQQHHRQHEKPPTGKGRNGVGLALDFGARELLEEFPLIANAFIGKQRIRTLPGVAVATGAGENARRAADLRTEHFSLPEE